MQSHWFVRWFFPFSVLFFFTNTFYLPLKTVGYSMNTIWNQSLQFLIEWFLIFFFFYKWMNWRNFKDQKWNNSKTKFTFVIGPCELIGEPLCGDPETRGLKAAILWDTPSAKINCSLNSMFVRPLAIHSIFFFFCSKCHRKAGFVRINKNKIIQTQNLWFGCVYLCVWWGKKKKIKKINK